jgi:hypothetical protein
VGALRVQYLRMVQIEQHHEGVEDLSDRMRLEEFCRQGPPTGAVMPPQRCGWRRPQGVCSVQYSLKERAASPFKERLVSPSRSMQHPPQGAWSFPLKERAVSTLSP